MTQSGAVGGGGGGGVSSCLGACGGGQVDSCLCNGHCVSLLLGSDGGCVSRGPGVVAVTELESVPIVTADQSVNGESGSSLCCEPSSADFCQTAHLTRGVDFCQTAHLTRGVDFSQTAHLTRGVDFSQTARLTRGVDFSQTAHLTRGVDFSQTAHLAIEVLTSSSVRPLTYAFCLGVAAVGGMYQQPFSLSESQLHGDRAVSVCCSV